MKLKAFALFIFKKSYGWANCEHDIPFTSSTLFDYASVSKQFTGYAIASLVRQGKLSLDDDIRQYLPEAPDFGETITVGHLLYHTSGIRDWVGLVKLSGRHETDVITDEFLMNEDQLVVEHFQNEEVLLVRVDRDHYWGDRWWFSEVRFIRDEDDHVIGFRLNADQDSVQNLLFVKK